MASGGAEGGSTLKNRTPRPITERFQAAVAMIRTLPKEGPYMADNKTKLRFYALYKQATEGPCGAPKPGFWDVVGKAKWEVWNICGNMSKEIAMQLYVEELTEMVKAMPETKEVSDFLESASPVLSEVEREGGEEEGGEEEGGEEEGGEEEGGEEEGGEEEGGEGGVPLSSSVLHRVEELELSRGERGEEEEEEEEGDVEKSVSSNGDYQESFQDMQGGSANGELLSPWQHVSPESLSPSFEVVASDSPHNKTPESKSTPEAPLPHPTTSVTPSSQNQVGGASSKVTATIRHGGGSSASGEGVNVGRGGERQEVWSRLGEGGVGREREEQIQTLSRSRLLQQQTGDDATTSLILRVARRQRRLRRIIHLSLLLLGWPLLVSHIFKSLPLWVWSAISASHVILSFLLRHWGFPL